MGVILLILEGMLIALILHKTQWPETTASHFLTGPSGQEWLNWIVVAPGLSLGSHRDTCLSLRSPLLSAL